MSEEQNGEYVYLFNGLVHRVKIARQVAQQCSPVFEFFKTVG